MTILQTKYSSTASAVPTAAVLIQGELAVNVTDKRLFTENNSGVVVELGTNPTSLTTGSIAVTGTVDGRDVSADGTKLDGIAANANNYVLPFTNNSTNWNTAFGWGNHATAGYYAASNPNGYTNDQTASEILTAIKTVDGTGSGLDADTVDGFNISTASTGTDANTIYFRT